MLKTHSKFTAELESCIYKVKLVHQRVLPKKHRFEYEIFMFLLALDELPEVSRRAKLLRVNKVGIYSFYDQDHFALSPESTRDKVRSFLADNGLNRKIGKILLLTNLRFLGYVFNPISIYFVHDECGAPYAAVAEVGNTFLERKPFLLPLVSRDGADHACFRLLTSKSFYVSPFSEVDDYFEFSCILPNSNLDVRINTLCKSQNSSELTTTLASTMRGERIALSDRNILLSTLRFPFVTFGVITLIHLHALILFLKGVKFHRKEDKPESQTGLINPHLSLVGDKAADILTHKGIAK